MSAYLPSTDGLLPYFLLYTSLSAIIHTIVCYTTSPRNALKAFSGPKAPVPTGLLARTYGVKNMYTAAIRGLAAYQLDDRRLYDLCMLTFVGVLVLYIGEVFVWRTARVREGMFPFITAGGGLAWMIAQRQAYLWS